MATITPLPAAKPICLDYNRCARLLHIIFGALNIDKMAIASAVGAPAASQMDLVKNFEASSCAAAWLGPKHNTSEARNKSATPAASGASGPIITKVNCLDCAQTPALRYRLKYLDANAVCYLGNARISRRYEQSITFWILRSTAQAKECSRPPLPNIKIFITRTPLGLCSCRRSKLHQLWSQGAQCLI